MARFTQETVYFSRSHLIVIILKNDVRLIIIIQIVSFYFAFATEMRMSTERHKGRNE